ncbi:polysaccharide deacetylase domain protein [Natrialba magadii ATCC 43099]|uniref:Polysaccharide deacetylase n=1 Tax=Natrialba magadii (strain ATCC 43099 / DSM 3394 / CCM 3739 / CIP 104546 / IAM 13178 / JCM 8861 / NBRC 102185 / NCIMB 2190 / MS3) TaxID=547559 RepID=D3SZ13_NATMM|nr:polysaccharide deacetylase family protein [Natrialba magadii]ADD06205.1 polysaccharide deacetylase domain protein [Natrialba magadii ATCC 43099]ELY31080.1 polysaccharide deacetylase [Natrialba magadii ATCC 43099]
MDRRTYLSTSAATIFAGCTELSGADEPDADDDRNGSESTDGDESTDGATDDPNGSDQQDDYPELAGSFDNFEDLDEWWEWQDIGFLEADRSRSYDGTQCALLTSSPESEGQVRIRRRLDEPIDVRDVAPGLALATDTDQGVVRIQLQDEDAHYLEYSTQFPGGTSLTHDNFGVTRVRGDPDLSEVVVLQVIRWFGGDAEGRQWVDDFHFVPKPERGKVLLQFHGGYEEHYTDALSRVSSTGIPAAAFVPPERLRGGESAEDDRLTREQVGELADEGWTIGVQAAAGRHLEAADADRVEAAVVDPVEWLADEGYDDVGRFFAYPYSQYSEAASELVRENYDLAFAGHSSAQGFARNPHRCSVLTNPTPEEATAALERTVRWNGITTFAFHRLSSQNERTEFEETLSRIEAHAAAGELDVITPAEMADEYVY